jgi:hypothetical protein
MTKGIALALAVSAALSCSQQPPPVASAPPAPEPAARSTPASSEPAPEPSPAPAQAASSKAPAELNLATVDAMLQALVGTGRGLSAAELLLRLGFDADSVASLNATDVSSAKRLEDNLDADEDLESVIVIDAALPNPSGGAPGRQVYLVWAEAGPPLSSVGRMRFQADSCAVEAAIDVDLAPVHAPGFADTVIAVESSLGCDGNLRASHRTVVLTLERKKLETLLDFTDQSEVARDSGKTLDPALRVVFAGKPPRIAELRDDAKRMKKRLSFQPAPFVYR